MQKSIRRFLSALHNFGGGRAGWRAGSKHAAACGRIILAGATRNLLALEAHVIGIYSEGIPELSPTFGANSEARPVTAFSVESIIFVCFVEYVEYNEYKHKTVCFGHYGGYTS
jgi:hypothetical protein